MIDDLLKKFTQHLGCITFAGATAEEIAETNILLQNQSFSAIPEPYYKILYTTNGLICDGLELMGTKAHLREEKHYTFPDLLQINQPYSNYEYFAQKLVLGRSAESLVIYDQPNNYYAVVDRVNLLSRLEVDNVERLLMHLCKVCSIKD